MSMDFTKGLLNIDGVGFSGKLKIKYVEGGQYNKSWNFSRFRGTNLLGNSQEVLNVCGFTSAEDCAADGIKVANENTLGNGDKVYTFSFVADDDAQTQQVTRLTQWYLSNGIYSPSLGNFALLNSNLQTVEYENVGANIGTYTGITAVYLTCCYIHWEDFDDMLVFIWIANKNHGTTFDTTGNQPTLNVDFIKRTYNAVIYETDGSEAFGDPSDDEGYAQEGKKKGVFDHESDVIQKANKPVIGISDAGFIRLYAPTKSQLEALGVVLFPPSPTQASDAVEALLAIAAGLYNTRFVDSIIDCHIIPVSPITRGSEDIICASVSTGVSAARVSEDYVDVSCGSLSIGNQYANFADLYIKYKLFLPFIGFVDIKSELITGGTLTVEYRFNVVDGSFVCFVFATSGFSKLNRSLIGQFGGNACVHFPLTGAAYSSMLAGLITGSMSLAANAASGNVAGEISDALTMVQSKPTIASSNNYNCSTAFLGNRKPYLVIERPVPSFSTRYHKECGLPLNVTKPLSTVHGFTIIDDINFVGQTFATDQELDDIREKLANGVIM